MNKKSKFDNVDSKETLECIITCFTFAPFLAYLQTISWTKVLMTNPRVALNTRASLVRHCSRLHGINYFTTFWRIAGQIFSTVIFRKKTARKKSCLDDQVHSSSRLWEFSTRIWTRSSLKFWLQDFKSLRRLFKYSNQWVGPFFCTRKHWHLAHNLRNNFIKPALALQ